MDRGSEAEDITTWSTRREDAGFQPVKECGPDSEHAVPWLLMLFDPGEGA